MLLLWTSSRCDIGIKTMTLSSLVSPLSPSLTPIPPPPSLPPSGAHLALRDGYDQLPTALAKGLDIRLNTEVISIHYSTDGEMGVWLRVWLDISLLGVEVHARSTQTASPSVFRADAVVLSIPLGVLKANVVSFHPPLPEWKTQAINNLGFGLLNKVGVCHVMSCDVM